MLLRQVVLLADVSLQRREDALLLQQFLPTLLLQVDQLCTRLPGARVGRGLGNIAFRRDGKVFELLAKDDNGLLGQEWILGGSEFGRNILRSWVNQVLLSLVQSREAGGSVESILRLTEER